MTRPARATAVALSALALAGGLTACGDTAGASDAETLTVYSAQHESLVRTMVEGFTEETGIELEFRDANDAELANQIVQEGEASPADVFLTENSPAIDVVDDAGLLAPLDQSTLDQVDEAYRPSSGNWVGFAARSTVLAYQPAAVAEADLPASILELADPAYEGRVGIAAGGADFQAIVSAVLALEGEDATRVWLTGLQRNAEVYASNTAVMKAVDEAEVPVGVMYHYYWYRDRAENGLIGDDAELHYFGDQDPGAFVSVSGAGVLASSDMQEEAEQFVQFLVGEEGQQALADSYALEYPLNPAVELEGVKPFSELEPPQVNVSDLDAERVVELMTEVGFL